LQCENSFTTCPASSGDLKNKEMKTTGLTGFLNDQKNNSEANVTTYSDADLKYIEGIKQHMLTEVASVLDNLK
jgi:hypothetical protein